MSESGGNLAGWEKEAEEIQQRYQWAEAMGGEEAVRLRHEKGFLTVRERIAGIADPDSFQEVGKLTGKGQYDEQGRLIKVTPAPYVMGIAEVDGRPVAIGGEDTTIRGGTSWGHGRRKGGQGGFIDDLAHQYRIPLVRLIDGYGGGVASAKRGFTVFPGHTNDPGVNVAELLGMVPVVSAVLGVAAGGPAQRAVMSHWSVMVKNSTIFASGPPIVERGLGQKLTKEELGGPKVAVDSAGTIDNVAASEQECFQLIRRFLSYLPTNVWQMPPVVASTDPVNRREEELIRIVPRDPRKPYSMKRVIEMIVDRGSMFEIQGTYGRSAITSLARLNGYPVGVIGNNPMVGGRIDVKSARKQAHFIELCDCFHIPIIFFLDVPGFMIGKESEEAAILREGARAIHAKCQATVPLISVVTRKCYGMGGGVGIDKYGLDFKIAWPSGEWGSLAVEGGVRAQYKREIESAPDPAKREKEIEAELKRITSPFLSAEAFAVEDLIDPRDTRAYLCRFVKAMQPRLQADVGQRPKYGVRP
ncbi:MAG: carboxyl transferase domain-containing protein [Burkholderiales bacterium]|nr:carboxyl transferase domain-containing protein [Burkholderiales bacterium]